MTAMNSEYESPANNKAVINDALKDPSRQFNSPEDVFEDERFSVVQKRKILENWRLDAEALLRAEEESMLSTNLTNKPSKLLQRITNLLAQLD
jgi:hypothetical protein